MFQKKADFILSGWNTVCKSLSGSCNKLTYLLCLLAEKIEEECVSERWGSPFCHFICKVAPSSIHCPNPSPKYSAGQHSYLRETESLWQRILHKNAVIPWRSGYDYMKKEPIPVVGEWTISSGYPGTLGKTDVSCDPSVNHSRTSVLQFRLNFIILTCSKHLYFLPTISGKLLPPASLDLLRLKSLNYWGC